MKRSKLYNKYTEVSALNDSGLSQHEIAKRLNVSVSCVNRFFKQNGLKVKDDFRKYSCDDNFFSEANEWSAYWAGFLAADGCISKNQIKVELAPYEEHHLNKFKNIINSNGNIKTTKKSSTITITSKQMISDLFNNFNITNRKTYTLNPPRIDLEEYARDFIRGYVDGDGCVYVKKPSFSFVGTKQMVEWIKSNIQQNCLNIGDPSVVRLNGAFEVSFSGRNQVPIILNWLYKKRGYEIR